MSTATSTGSSAPASGGATRPSAERLIVWGGILVLLVILGTEFWAKRGFEKGMDTLQNRLAEGEKPGSKGKYVTNFEVLEILGKEPAFKGDPGQIDGSSRYYEVYVWKSLLKRQFTMPPEKPETVDMWAIYSGEVRPDLIKYRTPEPPAAEGFFAAYALYVYYGPEDPKTKAREVVDISVERKKYLDQIRRNPTPEELEKLHKTNLAQMVGMLESHGRPKLTPEQVDKLDQWKNPQPRSDENMRNLPPPGGIPDVKQLIPKELLPTKTDDKASKQDPSAHAEGDREPPAKKPADTKAVEKKTDDKKPDDKKPEDKKPEDKKPEDKDAGK